MIKVIMIISNRPACGQTTVAVNLASGLSRKGYRVLIGDTGNNEKLRHWLGIDRQDTGTKAAKPYLEDKQAKIFSSSRTGARHLSC
ncbi:ParA family protein [Syntrophomonas wolfei]|uniref:Putative partition-related protein n=1 Tax=Syntrophomonas wolfei subsp. wolfei (strain DSM 2245B / Goettingen) TaxID=335541 RepID=Q0AWQ6_SYNWW|nr:AAA family ATPase [Syntrophomonas wolfei]ABI68848.1 putative partition-related protein [Syntrophomonas wolfei subsp. wolfei str. Goettingen G311]